MVLTMTDEDLRRVKRISDKSGIPVEVLILTSKFLYGDLELLEEIIRSSRKLSEGNDNFDFIEAYRMLSTLAVEKLEEIRHGNS